MNRPSPNHQPSNRNLLFMGLGAVACLAVAGIAYFGLDFRKR